MRPGRTIELPRSGTLTRRQMVTALAAVGVLTSSFTPVLAAAKEVALDAPVEFQLFRVDDACAHYEPFDFRALLLEFPFRNRVSFTLWTNPM